MRMVFKNTVCHDFEKLPLTIFNITEIIEG
jgi:hypothetical protein